MMVRDGVTQGDADRAIKDRIKLGKAYIIDMLTSRSYAEGVDDTIRRGIYISEVVYKREGGFDRAEKGRKKWFENVVNNYSHNAT